MLRSIFKGLYSCNISIASAPAIFKKTLSTILQSIP